jgi:hypothetical protein
MSARESIDFSLRKSHSLGSASHRNVNLRTKHSESSLPRRVSQVELGLLEKLFDRSPDVAFFVKDAAGRYVAVNESLVARHGLKSKSQAISAQAISGGSLPNKTRRC